jgi:hypothetical protein
MSAGHNLAVGAIVELDGRRWLVRRTNGYDGRGFRVAGRLVIEAIGLDDPKLGELREVSSSTMFRNVDHRGGLDAARIRELDRERLGQRPRRRTDR